MSSAASELHQMASLGRLLAGLVHEINTPIGSICSNNGVITRSFELLLPLLADGSPEALAKARKIVENCASLAEVDKIACERMRSVIRGMRTFARVDAGEPQRVNLNEILRDTIKLTAAEFRRRVTVETEFGELPEVECYPQMLGQVFLNLLINAGQAIEGEGRIMVRTWASDESVCIDIADTGRGMSLEEQHKAFEAGFTTKPKGEGTGLGLSIAREIVEDRHRGKIAFESRRGVGTTFHISIPVRLVRSSQS